MRQLEQFVAVADEVSFFRGAARVHVVQSAVSNPRGPQRMPACRFLNEPTALSADREN
jgi:hypothetical protein